jgi:hypothetical protein
LSTCHNGSEPNKAPRSSAPFSSSILKTQTQWRRECQSIPVER